MKLGPVGRPETPGGDRNGILLVLKVFSRFIRTTLSSLYQVPPPVSVSIFERPHSTCGSGGQTSRHPTSPSLSERCSIRGKEDDVVCIKIKETKQIGVKGVDTPHPYNPGTQKLTSPVPHRLP